MKRRLIVFCLCTLLLSGCSPVLRLPSGAEITIGMDTQKARRILYGPDDQGPDSTTTLETWVFHDSTRILNQYGQVQDIQITEDSQFNEAGEWLGNPQGRELKPGEIQKITKSLQATLDSWDNKPGQCRIKLVLPTKNEEQSEDRFIAITLNAELTKEQLKSIAEYLVANDPSMQKDQVQTGSITYYLPVKSNKPFAALIWKTKGSGAEIKLLKYNYKAK